MNMETTGSNATSESYTPNVAETPKQTNEPAQGKKKIKGVGMAHAREVADVKPLALLEQPHIVNCLDIAGFLEDNIDNSQKRVEFIDRAIKHNLDKNDWVQTTKSYEEFLEIAKERAGVDENQDKLTRLEKLYYFFKLGIAI